MALRLVKRLSLFCKVKWWKYKEEIAGGLSCSTLAPAGCAGGAADGRIEVLLADSQFGLDFFDDFVADPLYLGKIFNGCEFAVGGAIGDNGFSLGLADSVERCQFIRSGRVDVYFCESGCRKKENEHKGQEQLFHDTSILGEEDSVTNTVFSW